MRKKVYYYSLQPSDTTAFWRTGGVLPYINHPDFELTDISALTQFNWSSMIGVSVLIFQRPFTKEHADLIVLAKDLGVKIILDYDDLLTKVDMYNPTYHLYQSNQKSLNDCIRMADEIWVSTQAIANNYRHPNCHVIPNCWNDFQFPTSEKRKFTPNKKCMWRGGSSHRGDVMSMADELIKVINDNKDWTFLFQGDRFEYIEMRTGENHHIVNGMSIIQYFKYLFTENPSVMMFPLCGTEFNGAKSNIAWLEATYAGSAFFGNTNLPEFNQTGTLPISKVQDLLKQTDMLEKANSISWEYISDNLLLSKINDLRINRILANL